MHVHLGVNAKRPGHRMRNGHFSQRPHERQRDSRGGGVAQNHAWTRQLHGKRAAEKKAGADGAPDGNHGKLPRRQIAVQPSFAFQDGRGVSNIHLSRSSGMCHGAASEQTVRQPPTPRASGSPSIARGKEADTGCPPEPAGAPAAMRAFAAHGAPKFPKNLPAPVPASDRGQQFANAFIEGYRAKFNPDNATAQLVTVYDQHFTQDEIKGLLQFYGSPLGQKFAAEMPKINLEMQAANRAFSMRIAKDVLQDLRKQYPGVAARARLTKPRQGQVEQAQQQAQTQPTQP